MQVSQAMCILLSCSKVIVLLTLLMFLVEQIVIRNMKILTMIMYFQHITLVVIISFFWHVWLLEHPWMVYSEQVDDVFVLVL